jgi:hypothetical protein
MIVQQISGPGFDPHVMSLIFHLVSLPLRTNLIPIKVVNTFKKNVFFVGLPHLGTYIFLIFSTNEPELGAGINPGMVLNVDHFHLVFWIRQDLNSQPLDCESSWLTTRLDLRPVVNTFMECSLMRKVQNSQSLLEHY